MESITTETTPIPGASILDLKENLVREHILIAIRQRGYQGSTDIRDYLVRHKCVVDIDGTLVPTLAGILVFARDPNTWVQHAGIDVVQFATTDPDSRQMLLSRQIRGDISTLIDQTTELLWARSEHRIVLRGTTRLEIDAYPIVALRELTANTLIHRNWDIKGARVRVQMFPDRIEWISPGGFIGSKRNISFEELIQEQMLRNPILAQQLYLSGRVEAFGIGLDSVANAVRNTPRMPLVHNTRSSFTICVWGRDVNIESPAANVAAPLTDRQTLILEWLRHHETQTVQEIAAYLNETPRTIQRDLRVLLAYDLVNAEGQTRNRRYRIVETTRQ